ncbi:hypothetical protein [Comamonas sp.]|uniref:hypothetical protein n=1 Tax=Comamonas sp. TaxID=34028 RepID=UPI003A94E83B
MKLESNTIAIVAAVVLLTAGAVLWTKRPTAAEAGAAVGSAVVDMGNGLITGTVTGIGSAMGIPLTNMTECERAIAEGRTWDASFACPAGTFIKSLFN